MANLKRALLALLLTILVLMLLNGQYFLVQINYYLNPPRRVEVKEQPPTEIPMGRPNTLFIPSLGIDAPIIYVEEESEDEFQKGLRSGVVHYPATALPGEAGNVYIFGHSSDFITSKGDYKTVFALLPKIRDGDIIQITDGVGRIYQYKVAGTKVVDPEDLTVLEQDHSKRQLSLQTSYPVGTALKRFVVISYLIQ